LDGNINTIKKTTEVLVEARWEDRLEEDARTTVSNYIITMVLFVIGYELVVWNTHAYALCTPVKKVCESNQVSPKVTWKSPLSAKFLGHFSPIVPPSVAGFASVASDAGGLLWRKLERSQSLVLLQVGGFDVPLATALCKTFLLRMLNSS
jgi:hypothetical protein